VGDLLNNLFDLAPLLLLLVDVLGLGLLELSLARNLGFVDLDV